MQRKSRKLAQAGSGSVHQNSGLTNDTKTNGRVDKQRHSCSIRSHAINVVRQRQRHVVCIHDAESQFNALGGQYMELSKSSPAENLNNGAFSVAALELSRQYWDVADCFMSSVYPQLWEHESLRQITSIAQADEYSTFDTLYKTSVLERKRACLGDPLHAFAAVAVSLAGLTWVLADTKNTGLANLFMGFAIEGMRARFERPSSIDQNVFYSMVSLSKAETWRGNFEAALTHMRMISCMDELLNGNAPPLLLDLALTTDKHIALHLFQPPLIPLTFDPGPAVWPSLWQRTWHSPDVENAFTNLGSLLMDKRMRRVLGLELSTIIRDLRDCILAALDVRSYSGSNPIEPSYARWFFLRTTAITYRLLHLHCSSSSSSSAENPSSSFCSSPRSRSQNCVRLALINWIALITADFSFSPSLSRAKLAARLEAALAACTPDTEPSGDPDPDPDTDSLSPEVLLWAASLGSTIAFDEPCAASRRAFAAAVRALMRRLHLRSAADVRAVLEKVFYLGIMQDRAHGRADGPFGLPEMRLYPGFEVGLMRDSSESIESMNE